MKLLFFLFEYFNILFLEMWRLLGVRASQMLEDFDSEMCHQLYEDSRSTSNPSPSRSDHNVTNTVYSVQYLSILYTCMCVHAWQYLMNEGTFARAIIVLYEK